MQSIIFVLFYSLKITTHNMLTINIKEKLNKSISTLNYLVAITLSISLPVFCQHCKLHSLKNKLRTVYKILKFYYICYGNFAQRFKIIDQISIEASVNTSYIFHLYIIHSICREMNRISIISHP